MGKRTIHSHLEASNVTGVDRVGCLQPLIAVAAPLPPVQLWPAQLQPELALLAPEPLQLVQDGVEQGGGVTWVPAQRVAVAGEQALAGIMAEHLGVL